MVLCLRASRRYARHSVSLCLLRPWDPTDSLRSQLRVDHSYTQSSPSVLHRHSLAHHFLVVHHPATDPFRSETLLQSPHRRRYPSPFRSRVSDSWYSHPSSSEPWRSGCLRVQRIRPYPAACHSRHVSQVFRVERADGRLLRVSGIFPGPFIVLQVAQRHVPSESHFLPGVECAFARRDAPAHAPSCGLPGLRLWALGACGVCRC